MRSIRVVVFAMLMIIPSAWDVVMAQEKKLSGTVRDENGEVLIGAGVMAQDGRTGTVTDINGHYSIMVPSGTATLSFSFLNYTTQTVLIGDRTRIDVILQPDAGNSLNEVVVIGYGTAKKADLTGSVTVVKVQDIESAPASSIDHALQGRVAGMDVMSTTGEPGAQTSIRIRGTRSINASNEPLIIVDGVLDAVADIGEINSADVESITVLKDASSTAIYGSRGANGVILVTTKQGTSSRPSVTVRARFGVSMLAKELDVMNASEFIRYMNDLSYFRNGNKTNYAYDEASISNDTNWLRAVTRVAPYQDYSLTVSGKMTKFRYYGSLGYNDEQGIVIGSGARRVTGRLKLDYEFAKWISADLNLSYTFRGDEISKAAIAGTSIWRGAVYLSPLMGIYDAVNPLYENGTTINNPYIAATMMKNNREKLTGSNVLGLTIKPVEGLVIRSSNSYKVFQRHDYIFNPGTLPAKLGVEGADASRYEVDSRSFSTENTITYTPKLKQGNTLKAMLGFSASSFEQNEFSLSAKGLLNDELLWNNMAGVSSKENYSAATANTKMTKESVFARLDWSYKKRYYLTATGRYDGASNFAKNKKWGFFPSAAFKWALKNEEFLKYTPWVHDLSLRLSAGRTGNDAIAKYQSLQAYATTDGGYPYDAATQGAAVYPDRVGDPDLTWEKTDLYNVALESSFFKGRLGITLEGYLSYTSDLLLNVKTIRSTGYSRRLTNLGKTSNKGLELSIDARIIEKPAWGWTSQFTLSHNVQRVEDIGQEEYVSVLDSPGNTPFMMYGYKKGYPLNSLWGFQYGGVWHNAEEVERNSYTHSYVSNTTANSASSLLGWPRYRDQNNDGVLSEEDLVYIGNSDPIVFGGWQNNFHYKNLKLSVFLTYSIGGMIYNYSEFPMSGGYMTNQYRYMLNAWHPLRNPDSDYPRAGTDDRTLPSDFLAHDASYLRLKEVSLSYRLPLNTRHKKGFRDITFSLSGHNLLLLTEYNGFDPDVSTNSEDATLRRVDIASYPRARQVIFSVQLRY